eukprot:2370149-Rhodomonas_salina.1
MIPSIQCSMLGRTTSILPKSSCRRCLRGSSGARYAYWSLHRLMNRLHCSKSRLKRMVHHESQLSSYSCRSPSMSVARASVFTESPVSPATRWSATKFVLLDASAKPPLASAESDAPSPVPPAHTHTHTHTHTRQRVKPTV